MSIISIECVAAPLNIVVARAIACHPLTGPGFFSTLELFIRMGSPHHLAQQEWRLISDDRDKTKTALHERGPRWTLDLKPRLPQMEA